MALEWGSRGMRGLDDGNKGSLSLNGEAAADETFVALRNQFNLRLLAAYFLLCNKFLLSLSLSFSSLLREEGRGKVSLEFVYLFFLVCLNVSFPIFFFLFFFSIFGQTIDIDELIN